MKLLKKAVVTLLLCTSPIAMAAIQQHTFSITGNNGETGTGSFTWDDAVVANGTQLAANAVAVEPEILTISITISGGNIVGGSTTFNRPDCTGAVLQNTPDFLADINFWCDNGTNDLVGVAPFANSLNGGASNLAFTPGATSLATAVAVPALTAYGLGLTALGLLLVASRRIRGLISRK